MVYVALHILASSRHLLPALALYSALQSNLNHCSSSHWVRAFVHTIPQLYSFPPPSIRWILPHLCIIINSFHLLTINLWTIPVALTTVSLCLKRKNQNQMHEKWGEKNGKNWSTGDWLRTSPWIFRPDLSYNYKGNYWNSSPGLPHRASCAHHTRLTAQPSTAVSELQSRKWAPLSSLVLGHICIPSPGSFIQKPL